MCLDNEKEIYPKKPVVGYKVFRIYPNNRNLYALFVRPQYKNYHRYEKRIWQEAKLMRELGAYVKGFHAFRTREGARSFVRTEKEYPGVTKPNFVIHKVLLKGDLVECIQFRSRGIRGRWMRILGKVR